MMVKQRARFIRHSMNFYHSRDKEAQKKPFYINAEWQYTEERFLRPLKLRSGAFIGTSTISQLIFFPSFHLVVFSSILSHSSVLLY